MITKFKIFESHWKDPGSFEPPNIDEQTIAIRSTENPSFGGADIYFNDDGKVIHVSGRRLIFTLPNWEGKKIDLKDVQNFIDLFNNEHFNRYSGKKAILYCDYLYKIIASQKYNL